MTLTDSFKYVLDRNGLRKGTLTGSTHRCQMEGCTGRRYSVKWPNGKVTFPCGKGLEPVEGMPETLKIM